MTPHGTGSRGRRAAMAAPALSAVLLLVACGVGDQSTTPSDASPLPTSEPSVTQPTPTDPIPPTAVAPGAERGVVPTAMAIPSISIDSPVVAVGTVDRVLQIPPKPWVVGWWKDGVGLAAGRGTAVMTAHLDSREYGAGPFTRAKNLRPGDQMILTDVSGVRHRYRVAAVDSYLKETLPYATLFAQSGPELVVIVTCGGRYDRDAGGWDSNVVVTFVPA